MLRYLKVRKYKEMLRERNDCSVICLAIACNVTYVKAWAALKVSGRKDRKMTSLGTLGEAALRLGYTLETVQVKAKTIRTLERDIRMHEGNYIAHVRGHVAAVVDGVVEDHTQGSLCRVRNVFKVSKMEG